MKPTEKMKWKRILKMVLIVNCFWTIPLLLQPVLPVPNIGVAIKTASADNHYGILGQPAPELNLNTWIDGDGEDIAPIKLRDYRNKVIYLYFFQDW